VTWRAQQKSNLRASGDARRIEHHLGRLVRGFRFRDLVWLARREELLNNIYSLSDTSVGLEAFNLDDSDNIPWPVVLLLGSHSKKFIFAPGKLTWKTVHERLGDFSNRVNWIAKWFWSDSVYSRPLVPRRVMSFNEMEDPLLAGVIAGVKSIVKDACRIVVGRRPVVPYFVSWATRWLPSNGFSPQLSDKDGVFVLIKKHEVIPLMMEQFQKPFYSAYGTLNLDPAAEKVKLDMKTAAKYLEPISKQWATELYAAASSRGSSLLCRALVTVKSHKVPVSVRLIHSSAANLLNPLCAAVHRLLDVGLRNVSHLCLGSDNVTEKLKCMCVTQSTVLLKFDVVDFYLSGEHDLIVREALRFVGDGPAGSFLAVALPIILANQFVQPTFDEELSSSTCFKVTKGSGMGLKHSGSLADAVLAKFVEESLLVSCPGIQGFLRFRDDVFAAIENPAAARIFIDKFRSLSAEFCEIKLEHTSLVSVKFLDMEIYKGPNGSLLHRPYIKPTARHIPLSSDSVHPLSVHRSWPVAEVRRMRRRASDMSVGQDWGAFKIARFRHYLLDSRIIEACKQELVACPSKVAAGFLLPSVVASEVVGSSRVARIVLPFHPLLRNLPKCIMAYVESRNGLLKDALGITLKTQICWGKAGKSLSQLVVGGCW
jgi:hypothetical protein